MSTRRMASSGGPWETQAGYCRAVRVGNHIAVAGTVAVDGMGNVIGPGDAYTQTKAIFATIEQALADLDASLSDVVRTRSFITELDQFEQFGRAHGEIFSDIRPAATLVEVSGLIGDGTVIEIEADAIVE
ncbi:MAG: RidA family protein [Actinomycetota bacterium]